MFTIYLVDYDYGKIEAFSISGSEAAWEAYQEACIVAKMFGADDCELVAETGEIIAFMK